MESTPTPFFSLLRPLLAHWTHRRPSRGVIRGRVRWHHSLLPTPVLPGLRPPRHPVGVVPRARPRAGSGPGLRAGPQSGRRGGLRGRCSSPRRSSIPFQGGRRPASFPSKLSPALSLVRSPGSRSTLHLLSPKFILQLWVNLAGIPLLR